MCEYFFFLIFFQPVHLSTRNPDLSPSHSHESVSSLSCAVALFVPTADRIERSNISMHIYIYITLFIFDIHDSSLISK